MGSFYMDAHWKQQKEALALERSTGLVVIRFKGGRMLVNAPLNKEFDVVCRQMGGSYREKTEQWTFPIRSLPMLRGYVESIYGKDKVQIK